MNDIIDSTGEISENVILEKLGNKHSWIMEFSKLNKAISTTWKFFLKSNCSIQAKVKTNLTLKLRLNNGKVFNLENTNNKMIYNTLISRKFSFSYIHTYWNTYFDKIICWKNVYKTIHKLEDNRIKQFKFKLIHKIVPSKEIRYTWKISTTPYCNNCEETESYKHLFIECKQIKDFWNKINDLFKFCGINKNINSLYNIVIGYKIDHPEYIDINKIFSLIGFSIYKTYFLSESRTKKVNCFSIFCQEFKEMSRCTEHKLKTSNNFERQVRNYIDSLNNI